MGRHIIETKTTSKIYDWLYELEELGTIRNETIGDVRTEFLNRFNEKFPEQIKSYMTKNDIESFDEIEFEEFETCFDDDTVDIQSDEVSELMRLSVYEVL